MKHPLLSLMAALLFSLFAAAASAAVVATDQWVMPLAPSTEQKHLTLPANQPIDPDKPVWVAYKMLAISAADNPTGEIVLEPALEMVPVPLNDMYVIFSAGKMDVSKSAGTIGDQLKAKFGNHTPEQMKETFGPEIYAAYTALNEKHGSILQKTIVKTYGPTGTAGATLLLSINRATGMQPMLISVAMGQGEIPAEYRESEEATTKVISKVISAVLTFLIAMYFWRRRKK
jgi:hypothetical protein